MSCPIFFSCTDKKGILQLVQGSKEELKSCMGDCFEELDPAKAEGAGEKHIPIVDISGNLVTVTIGSVAHPMTEEHGIDWIYLETTEGGQLKKLNPGREPKVQFSLTGEDKPIAAYAYCNLHGFWKTDIK